LVDRRRYWQEGGDWNVHNRRWRFSPVFTTKVMTFDTGRFFAASASKVREDSTLNAGAISKATIKQNDFMSNGFDDFVKL
jgi:hypothetical protein